MPEPMQSIPPREGVPSADTTFDNIPEDWIVVWCNGCGATVTVDNEAGQSYGEDWVDTYRWSVADCHGNNEECPAKAVENPGDD